MNILQACFSATLPLSISFVIENLELDECTLQALKLKNDDHGTKKSIRFAIDIDSCDSNSCVL